MGHNLDIFSCKIILNCKQILFTKETIFIFTRLTNNQIQNNTSRIINLKGKYLTFFKSHIF